MQDDGIELFQIGEAAERLGLSIRTIRHYDDVGLIVPSARSAGGFRLYTEADLSQLHVVKQMKPLGFTLDQMREVLAALGNLESGELSETQRRQLTAQLRVFHDDARDRVKVLQRQATAARAFAERLQEAISEK